MTPAAILAKMQKFDHKISATAI